MVGVGSRSGRTKPITKHGNVHCDWFILPLLLLTPTSWFSLDHKWNVSDGVVFNKAELEEIEMFWFFWLWFCRVYGFAYDSDLWFSLGRNPFTTQLTTLTATPLLVKTSVYYHIHCMCLNLNPFVWHSILHVNRFAPNTPCRMLNGQKLSSESEVYQ